MKENSIKNERSSIKEDIKDIEKYISFTSKRENFSHDTDWNWNKDLANKIEHILSDYKRVLKENEELKNQEAAARKINELLVQRYSNSIPVQKVKDKIEEEKLPLVIVGGRRNKKTLEYGIKLGRRQVLQELLEGRK